MSYQSLILDTEPNASNGFSVTNCALPFLSSRIFETIGVKMKDCDLGSVKFLFLNCDLIPLLGHTQEM